MLYMVTLSNFLQGFKRKTKTSYRLLIDIESDPVMFLNHLAFEWVTFVCIYLNALFRLINPIFHSFQLKGKLRRQFSGNKAKMAMRLHQFSKFTPVKVIQKIICQLYLVSLRTNILEIIQIFRRLD